MRAVTRLAIILLIPLVVLSVLLAAGLFMTTAFVVQFSVVNRTSEPILVTPVGSVGRMGHRNPLPIQTDLTVLHMPSRQVGGFLVKHRSSILLRYDMDDINFSELVIEDGTGNTYQLVVNQEPTKNRYQAPAKTQFVIDSLADLSPVAPEVHQAYLAAQAPDSSSVLLLAFIVVPWSLLFILLRLQHLLRRRAT